MRTAEILVSKAKPKPRASKIREPKIIVLSPVPKDHVGIYIIKGDYYV